MTRLSARTAGAASLAVAAALAMGACAGPALSGESGESGESSSAVDFTGVEPATEISFWSTHPGYSLDMEKAAAAAFKEKTGITVNIVSSGSSYGEAAQKYQTAQVSGDAGDLTLVSDVTWFSAYLNDSIMPIDEVFKAADLDTSTYYDAFFSDYAYDGQHYAVPYARSALVFMYNKDQFAKAGIQDAPTTWEELRTAAIKLKESGASDIPFGWPSDTSYVSWVMTPLLWSSGTDWATDWDFSPMTSEKTVSSVQWAQDSVTDGWAQVLSGDPSTLFGAGSVGMLINSSGGLRTIADAANFDYGIAKVPSGPGGDKVVATGGAGIAINSNTTPERQLAAAMFASFLTSEDYTKQMSEKSGYLPVRQGVDVSAAYEEFPGLEVSVESLADARSQSNARTFVPGGGTALDKGLMEILVSKADVTQTLQGVQTTLEQTYESQVKPHLR